MNEEMSFNEFSPERGEMRAIREKINPAVFKRFFQYLEDGNFDPGKLSGTEIELIKLAKDGRIEAFRKLEKILNDGNLTGDAKDFALTALNYCRYKIENDLLDFPVDLISGGLGGENNKIRYFLAVTGADKMSESQYITIERAFRKAAEQRDSVLEELKIKDFYVSLIILGSLDYAIGEIIDEGLYECSFLNKEYYLTNTEIPSDEQIRDWIDGKLDSEV